MHVAEYSMRRFGKLLDLRNGLEDLGRAIDVTEILGKGLDLLDSLEATLHGILEDRGQDREIERVELDDPQRAEPGEAWGVDAVWETDSQLLPGGESLPHGFVDGDAGGLLDADDPLFLMVGHDLAEFVILVQIDDRGRNEGVGGAKYGGT